MEENKKEIFLFKLSKEIKKTKLQIIKYSELCKPIAPENSIGRISRMDAINNKSVVEAALRESKQKLLDLEKIINKSNNKDFGVCIICKLEIPYGRLMIRPNSQKCVNCAT